MGMKAYVWLRIPIPETLEVSPVGPLFLPSPISFPPFLLIVYVCAGAMHVNEIWRPRVDV